MQCNPVISANDIGRSWLRLTVRVWTNITVKTRFLLITKCVSGSHVLWRFKNHQQILTLHSFLPRHAPYTRVKVKHSRKNTVWKFEIPETNDIPTKLYDKGGPRQTATSLARHKTPHSLNFKTSPNGVSTKPGFSAMCRPRINGLISNQETKARN